MEGIAASAAKMSMLVLDYGVAGSIWSGNYAIGCDQRERMAKF